MNGAIPALMRGEQAVSIQVRGAIIQPGNREAPRFRTSQADTIAEEGRRKSLSTGADRK